MSIFVQQGMQPLFDCNQLVELLACEIFTHYGTVETRLGDGVNVFSKINDRKTPYEKVH